MDKKKIILIAVILLLLIGLGSFVFANPDNSNDENLPGVVDDENTDVDEDNDFINDEQLDDETNEVIEDNEETILDNNLSSNNNNNDENVSEVVDSNDKAYENAKKLVAELQNLVNTMNSSEDSKSALEYREESKVVALVNALPNGKEKTELLNALKEISAVLDDNTKPVITGYPTNGITNKNVVLTVTEENSYVMKVFLNGEQVLYNINEPLTKEGKYEIFVTDSNFNSDSISFTIDKTAPTIKLNGDETIYLNFGNEYNESGVVVSEGTYTTVITYSQTENGTYTQTDKIDTNKSGYYKITYSVKDVAENENFVERNVVVLEEDIIAISNQNELIEAIKNQKDGQTLLFVSEGVYDINNTTDGATGQYFVPTDINTNDFTFPIYASNFTITTAEGVDNVTITSSHIANDGNWDNQNFITIWGNNVTIEKVNLKSNINTYYENDCNKVIEILADNTVIKNVNIMDVSNKFSGSIYVNIKGATTTLENVNLEYGRISLSGADETNTLNINNVNVDFANSSDEINFAIYNPNNAKINSINLTISVSNQLENDMEDMLNMLPNKTTVLFESGEYNLESLFVNKELSLIGSSDGKTLFNVSTPANLSGKEGGAILIAKSGNMENIIINMSEDESINDYKSDAIKITSEKYENDSLVLIENYSFKNVEINGGLSGLNIHGVKNAKVDGIVVNNTKKLGISIASSNVEINNANIQSGIWGNIGIMYAQNSSYPTASMVKLGTNITISSLIYAEGNEFGNGFEFSDPSRWTQIENSYAFIQNK